MKIEDGILNNQSVVCEKVYYEIHEDFVEGTKKIYFLFIPKNNIREYYKRSMSYQIEFTIVKTTFDFTRFKVERTMDEVMENLNEVFAASIVCDKNDKILIKCDLFNEESNIRIDTTDNYKNELIRFSKYIKTTEKDLVASIYKYKSSGY